MAVTRLQYNAQHPIAYPRTGLITRPFYYWVQMVESAIQNPILGPIPIPNSVLTSDNLNVVAFRTILPAVDGSAVTNLNASALASGTVPLARLSGITTAQLAANAGILLTQLQNINTDRLIGRDTAGAGVPEELTVSGGIEFTGAGGIQTSAFTGDVTKPAGSTVQTIPNDTVTYAKIQNVTDQRLLGRYAGSAGDMQEVTIGSNLELTAGGALNADVEGAGYWTPLTDGDVDETELIFANGECIRVWVPTP